MLINERVKLIMKANRLNATQFAEVIGVKPANLSHILSGRNKPSMDFLEKVALTFPNVNASWLLTGEIRSESEELNLNPGEKPKIEATQAEQRNQSEIEKIVVFYTDGTYKMYTSSLDHSASN